MRYISLLALFLTACAPLGNAPAPTPQVTLSASQTEGKIPFTVMFTAEADPAVNVFSWSVGGERRAETSSTFQTTFERSGVYVVSVSADGLADNVTITATSPDVPRTGPGVGDLGLTATPGGPAPWAVRYTVTADADLSELVTGLEARCAENRIYQRVVAGSFTCVHNDADTVKVRFVVPDETADETADETVAEAETVPDIAENEGVAFAGRWRYTSRGVSETFKIVRGDETAGRSADGRFKLFTLGQQGGVIAEFTVDGQTVVLTPTPGDDGRQLFEGDVYGLVLEPLSGR